MPGFVGEELRWEVARVRPADGRAKDEDNVSEGDCRSPGPREVAVVKDQDAVLRIPVQATPSEGAE
jgi:hypothetical protein